MCACQRRAVEGYETLQTWQKLEVDVETRRTLGEVKGGSHAWSLPRSTVPTGAPLLQFASILTVFL